MKTLHEIDNLASTLLQKLPELMQAGTVYASDLVHRFVMYIIILNAVELLGIISILAFGCFITKKVLKWAKGDVDRMGGFICGFLVFVCISIPLLGVAVTCFNNLVQVYFVPEMFIINYFK